MCVIVLINLCGEDKVQYQKNKISKRFTTNVSVKHILTRSLSLFDNSLHTILAYTTILGLGYILKSHGRRWGVFARARGSKSILTVSNSWLKIDFLLSILYTLMVFKCERNYKKWSMDCCFYSLQRPGTMGKSCKRNNIPPQSKRLQIRGWCRSK